jgi:glycosyltransferase involved in cell wall biosynthesis
VKRVLLVAYYFPPQPKAGSLRASYLSSHLREFGWEPTVVTTSYPGQDLESGRVIATADWGPDAAQKTAAAAHGDALRAEGPPVRSRAGDSIRAMVKSVVYFPDNHVGWLPTAAPKARALVRERRISAVVSTAPPFTGHFIARYAIAGTQIPWIADYRDLWSGPPGADYLHGSGPLRQRIEYSVERRLLRRADAITAPSQSQADALARNFGRQVTMIPNAADMSVWEAIPDDPPRSFTICYTGKLWPTLRMPDEVFAAVARLRAAGDAAGSAVRFEFYGEDPELVTESARRHGISEIVRAHGEVDRLSALRAQRSAAALLLLADTSDRADVIQLGNPGSKIFEYAGAKRPILAFGRNNEVIEAMLSTSGLGYCARDEASCVAVIRLLYERFCSGAFAPDVSADWRPFSPRELAGRFAALLDDATGEGGASRSS